MLSDQVIVTATTFRKDEDVCIHIRNYDRGPKGLYPTKYGVKLTLGQWKLLERNMCIIDETLADIKEGTDTSLSIHLGSNVYVKVNTEYDGVNIRHWWWCKDSESVKPTRKGVYLLPKQWDILTKCFNDIEQAIPELKQVELCCDHHYNEDCTLKCTFCNPNPVKDSPC
jgi:hypothetical protein